MGILSNCKQKRLTKMNTIINNKNLSTESKKIDYSKSNYKNKDHIKLDSSGDEIVYEIKYKLSLWDYFLFIVMLLLGIVMVYRGMEAFLFKEIENLVVIILLVFGISCILASCYRLFYIRKNRFYVTTQGIGFERRKWFRMQKGFFRFGDVGVVMYYVSAPVYFDTSTNIFIFYPIHLTIKSLFLARFRDRNYKYYTFYKVLASICHDNVVEILTFIRQKTKEALESQGIEISDSELKDKIKHLLYKDI